MIRVGAELFFLVILSAVVIVLLPLGYFAVASRNAGSPALLVVSTDESTRQQVTEAARDAGYRSVGVYRYEDALEQLRSDTPIDMLLIDDSVPSSEAGLLVSMMNGTKMGTIREDTRPLILITDASEVGLTAPSYRADIVLARPVSVFILKEAIQAIRHKLERES